MASVETSGLPKSTNSSASSDKEKAPVHESDIAAGQVRIKRCMTVPVEEHTKSILKYKTVDESMHSIAPSETEDGGRVASHSRRINFGNIGVREYARTLGDNPSCSSGPPVSISWEYKEAREMTVEDYESNRPARRTQMEMVLPRKLRSEMLKRDWQISQRQIADAVRRNVKIKNQRRTTVNNLGKASNMELVLERITRKLKRVLLFQKSVSAQCKELEAKHNEAVRMRRQRLLEQQMAEEYEVESANSKGAKESVVDEKSTDGKSLDTASGREQSEETI